MLKIHFKVNGGRCREKLKKGLATIMKDGSSEECSLAVVWPVLLAWAHPSCVPSCFPYNLYLRHSYEMRGRWCEVDRRRYTPTQMIHRIEYDPKQTNRHLEIFVCAWRLKEYEVQIQVHGHERAKLTAVRDTYPETVDMNLRYFWTVGQRSHAGDSLWHCRILFWHYILFMLLCKLLSLSNLVRLTKDIVR